MEIVLIRHGESEINRANKEGRPIFCGQYDCGLSLLGAEQASALKGSEVLRGADAVFASDLKRAVRTAELLTDLPVITDSRLSERSLGVFEGKAVRDIQGDPRWDKYFNDENFKHFRRSFTQKAPGGESFSDVEKRVRVFLEELRPMSYGKVIIVSHSCTISCLIRAVTGISEEETLALRVEQCRPIVLNTDEL